MDGAVISAPVGDRFLSLVIPAHNEAANIGGVVARAAAVLDQQTARWEIVLVDDGSTDGTAGVAQAALGDRAASLRVIRHSAKRGYGVTVCDGLRAAGGEILAFIDGDGQFDPADLPLLLGLVGDHDLVAGRRIHRADPWHRKVVAGVFNLLVRSLYGLSIRDVDCGLKLMRREVFESASPILARSALFNTELFFKARRCGWRIIQVGVPHHPRTAGRRSGGRPLPILRAVRDLLVLRRALVRQWSPPAGAPLSGR